MTSVTWGRLSGDTSVFALDVALMDDPDGGKAADPDETASWGAFALWVDGVNLCSHDEQGEPVARVHWYLLPMLEWLAAGWDDLLHEERLPFAGLPEPAARAGGVARRRAVPSEGALDWAQAERVHAWQRRHRLRTAAAGGLLPDLWLRRRRSQLEVSVGREPFPGAAVPVRFPVTGTFVAPVEAAARALHGALADVVAELRRRRPASTRFAQLEQRVLTRGDHEARHRRRFALLSGTAVDDDAVTDLWREVDEAFSGVAPGDREVALGLTTGASLVLTGSPLALLFGSASPVLTPSDVEAVSLLVSSLLTAGPVAPLPSLSGPWPRPTSALARRAASSVNRRTGTW